MATENLTWYGYQVGDQYLKFTVYYEINRFDTYSTVTISDIKMNCNYRDGRWDFSGGSGLTVNGEVIGTDFVFTYTGYSARDLENYQKTITINQTDGTIPFTLDGTFTYEGEDSSPDPQTISSVTQYANIIHVHSWSDGVITVQPTAESSGTMTYTCSSCGETKTEELVLGQTWSISSWDDAVGVKIFLQEIYCPDAGYTIIQLTGISGYQSYRNGKITFNGSINVNGQTIWTGSGGTHSTAYANMGSWAEELYGTYPSSTDYISDSSGSSIPVVININGSENSGGYTYSVSKTESITLTEFHTHSYTSVVTVPTCTEQGYTTYTCSCGDSYVGNYTNPTGHNWNNGVITTTPTYEIEGIKTYTCSNCNATKTSIIGKLGKMNTLIPTVGIGVGGIDEKYIPYVYDATIGQWITYAGFVLIDGYFENYC